MRVITCSPNPFEGAYGKFLKTYEGPPLTIYTESVGQPQAHPKGEIRPISECGDLVRFLAFTAQIPACNGNWKFDVHRFCKKAFVWFHETRKGGKVFWFDSDVEWSAPVTEEKLDSLLGDAGICFLGRKNYHPCTSFVGWDSDKAGLLMSAYERLYLSSMFLRLPEWHDAYLFGYMLETAPDDLEIKNLTNGEPMENVFNKVFPFGNHEKGPGKFK